ncbi:Sensor protein QseC [Roseisalinus antarcticus]|uniref:histidine kinase n=1 Tax=Roseisalinus antarcticus TaxID=254357 RepID=A0A1Y5U0F2_9RHOB|nr:Sensor protein QseC [Roseisalinus antarcticus]
MTEVAGRSLQRRLLVTMAGGFAVLLILISLLLWTYSRNAANRTHDLLLAGAALSILDRTSVGPDGVTVDLPHSAMEILTLNPVDRVLYRIFLPGEREITGTPDLPLPSDLVAGATPVFYDMGYHGSEFRFVVQGRQLIGSDGRQWVAVQLGQTVEWRSAQQLSFFTTGLAGLAVLSLIGLGFVWVAIRTSLSPLREIASDLAQRAPSDLGLVKGAPPREIRGLFDAINGFIQSLSRSRALTETFIADVAHQTRTSLSALQGHLSLAVDAKDPEQMRSRLLKADRQAARTVRLTNQLLANAMVIHRSDRPSQEPIALKQLVRDILAESLRDSRMRQISLSFVGDTVGAGEDIIAGDSVSIREALRNLIENVVRHGPPDNTIAITLTATGAELRLSVEDAGPGIAEADLSRATERFTSLSAESMGSGLGLSIVKAVADGHGAELNMGRSRLGGLDVTLVFRRILAVLTLVLWALSSAQQAQAQTLLVHSATDTPAMQPLIEAFEARTPGVQVTYVEFQTIALYHSILDLGDAPPPDVVVSSAMDLQVDLVNRGLARRIQLPPEVAPPPLGRPGGPRSSASHSSPPSWSTIPERSRLRSFPAATGTLPLSCARTRPGSGDASGLTISPSRAWATSTRRRTACRARRCCACSRSWAAPSFGPSAARPTWSTRRHGVSLPSPSMPSAPMRPPRSRRNPSSGCISSTTTTW